jgi:hypothetical protein
MNDYERIAAVMRYLANQEPPKSSNRTLPEQVAATIWAQPVRAFSSPLV